ncbi:MAG TPA: tetratricopeptide repeat protein [Pyrinomonadaceae bacterium]|nr:tetratricopeptide repeat protein [Pyrinomonadaceae bacterium]
MPADLIFPVLRHHSFVLRVVIAVPIEVVPLQWNITFGRRHRVLEGPPVLLFANTVNWDYSNPVLRHLFNRFIGAGQLNCRQVVALYDRLLRIQPSPVVQLNRAVAIAMCEGPEAGLAHIDAVLEHGELANYYLAHSARADMYRRLGRTAEARSSYEKALALTQQEPERQFLQERIRQLK